MKTLRTILTESKNLDLQPGDKIRTLRGESMQGVVTKIEDAKVYFDHADSAELPKQYVAHISNVIKEATSSRADAAKLAALQANVKLKKMNFSADEQKTLYNILEPLYLTTSRNKFLTLSQSVLNFLDKLSSDKLKKIADADIKDVSGLAQARLNYRIKHPETIKEEKFDKTHIELLRQAYSDLAKIDVTSKAYKKLIDLLNSLPQENLKQLADANIRFVSVLAKNRIKKEVKENRCWPGYKPTPGVKAYEKGSCVKEEDEEIYEDAEYDGKQVTLNKPFRTSDGPKKFAVYVRNEKGNVIKLGFGDPNMEIKRDDPERRKNYRARHNCADPGPKWKANYWSCKMWDEEPVSKILEAINTFDFSELDGPRTKKSVGAIIGLKGSTPEDALADRFKKMGYSNINVSTKDSIIIVTAKHGDSVEKNYYSLQKSMSEAAPPDAKIEKWIIANKDRFKKQYGAEKGLSVLYAKAWDMYNKK